MLANQPLVDDGAIDHAAASKIARFVELCNTYEYPMLALIDTPGCVANWDLKGQDSSVEPGLTRWHSRPLIAHQQRTVPLVSVQVRRGRGLGATLMSGASSTRGVPALRLAWPGVEIGAAGRLLGGGGPQRVRRRDRTEGDARARVAGCSGCSAGRFRGNARSTPSTPGKSRESGDGRDSGAFGSTSNSRRVPTHKHFVPHRSGQSPTLSAGR